MLKLAEHILQTKATNFEPLQFVDHYEETVVERKHAAPRPQKKRRERIEGQGEMLLPIPARKARKPWPSRRNDQALVKKGRLILCACSAVSIGLLSKPTSSLAPRGPPAAS
jgi:hypothetical protein